MNPHRRRYLILCLAGIVGLAATQGCATRPQGMDQAPKLENREELLKTLGRPFRVERNAGCEIWHYRRHYWNLFTLTSATWEAQYDLDITGRVRSIEIQESSSSRRIWRRTKLPEDFQEFR